MDEGTLLCFVCGTPPFRSTSHKKELYSVSLDLFTIISIRREVSAHFPYHPRCLGYPASFHSAAAFPVARATIPAISVACLLYSVRGG